MNQSKPELLVTIFTDYICPFCFIGDLRLRKLMREYEIKINWCFLEIHPDNPPEGRPVEDLGYSAKQWNSMMGELGKMAHEEGVVIKGDRITTNSHKALLLAEATKNTGKEVFYELHHRLFHDYFTEGKNIGNPEILIEIAKSVGISEEIIQDAWSNPSHETRLHNNLAAARQLGISSVPTFYIGERKLVGAVTLEELEKAAKDQSI